MKNIIDTLDTLEVIATSEAEDAVLLHYTDEGIDTAVLVYHKDTAQQEVYVLWDMQSIYYPTTFAEVPEYEWVVVPTMD